MMPVMYLSHWDSQQAAALGEDLSTTKFDTIYASPLLRAHATGLAVHQRQSHNPPFIVNANLREHHFGIAEGHPWVTDMPEGMTPEEAFKQGIFSSTIDKFPEGEGFEDLLVRARIAIREVVLPHLEEASQSDVHIAIASHGHCIAMLVEALLSLDPRFTHDVEYFGLMNTAWTRAVVDVGVSTDLVSSKQTLGTESSSSLHMCPQKIQLLA